MIFELPDDLPWTVRDVVAAGAADPTSGPAVVVAGEPATSYPRLLALFDQVAAAVAGLGVHGDDMVAVALPDAPEAATARLAVGCAAVAAPCNPVWGPELAQGYLAAVAPAAVIVDEQRSTPSAQVAERMGLTTVVARPVAGSGLFELGDPEVSASRAPEVRRPDDLAMVAATSGSTAVPKRVPISHRGLCRSAHALALGLELGPDDVGLNLMPQFRSDVLTPWCAGGACAPTVGFDSTRLGGWLEALSPTWIALGPTVLQALLRLARRSGRPAGMERIRFAQSTGAPLSSAHIRDFEDHFGVPVLDTYGSAESHRVTANLPASRRTGSVGRPLDAEIEILDELGERCPAGTAGEIVVRGPRWQPATLGDAQASAVRFRAGWCHTGDRGMLDSDGFLMHLGREDDVINRGGEMIAPVPIEELLVTHPSVAQAVVVGVAHPTLGQDLAAAVVVVPGADLDPASVRSWLRAELGPTRAPRRIRVVDSLPLGLTGKVDRGAVSGQLDR